jgi:hypothetical protein
LKQGPESGAKLPHFASGVGETRNLLEQRALGRLFWYFARAAPAPEDIRARRFAIPDQNA